MAACVRQQHRIQRMVNLRSLSLLLRDTNAGHNTGHALTVVPRAVSAMHVSITALVEADDIIEICRLFPAWLETLQLEVSLALVTYFSQPIPWSVTTRCLTVRFAHASLEYGGVYEIISEMPSGIRELALYIYAMPNHAEYSSAVELILADNLTSWWHAMQTLEFHVALLSNNDRFDGTFIQDSVRNAGRSMRDQGHAVNIELITGLEAAPATHMRWRGLDTNYTLSWSEGWPSDY